MHLNTEQIRRDVLVIGASAGGLEPVLRLLSALPAEPPILVAVVIHRSPFGPSVLSQIVERRTRRVTVEPMTIAAARVGCIYLAPRDMHMVFADDKVVSVRGAKEHFTRPAVDPLFLSAAATYKRRVVGVLFSGGGGDGALGLVRIKAEGGISLVQTPSEAAIPSMPETAIREDDVDAALSVDELAEVLPALARGETVEIDRSVPRDRLDASFRPGRARRR